MLYPNQNGVKNLSSLVIGFISTSIMELAEQNVFPDLQKILVIAEKNNSKPKIPAKKNLGEK